MNKSSANPSTDLTKRKMVLVDSSFVARRIGGNNIIVLDTRSSEEFAAGCIRGSTSVCSSALVIRRLTKGQYPIESLLTPEDKFKYEQARMSDSVAVVVCDLSTASVDQLTEDSVAIHLLRKINKECKFAAFLAGACRRIVSNKAGGIAVT